VSSIVVQPAKLRTSAKSVTEAATDIGDVTCIEKNAIMTADNVQRAYQKFLEKWDERRDQLKTMLDVIAESMSTTADTFEGSDQDMATKLTTRTEL